MRSTRNQPFCWQEKKVLRLLRDRYKKSELVKLRALYCTITEIDSDFNSKSINYYTKTISTYSGLSTEWIPKGLKILSDLGILNIIDHREGGRFIGKELIFTPENVDEAPPKTVHGKTCNGKTVYGKTDTLEDSSLSEDNSFKEDNSLPEGGQYKIKKTYSIFKKPTIEDVTAYCIEKNNGVDPVQFYNFYEAKDWMIGKNKMKKWKACIATWARKAKPANNTSQDRMTREEMERRFCC